MSDKQILIDDDDSFKELQLKWRKNSLDDDEKDLYIKHLTLRHIDKKKSSRELQAENERLKSDYFSVCCEFESLQQKYACARGSSDDYEMQLFRANQRLEQYESTPERGLKAVMRGVNDSIRFLAIVGIAVIFTAGMFVGGLIMTFI